jgi:hypothetical protein
VHPVDPTGMRTRVGMVGPAAERGSRMVTYTVVAQS